MDNKSSDLSSLYGGEQNSSNENNSINTQTIEVSSDNIVEGTNSGGESSLINNDQNNKTDVSQQSLEFNFDPNTGEPIKRQTEMNFDPNTGLPINNQQVPVNQNDTSTDKKNKMNKNAILGFLFGLISLFVFWWFSFIGLSLCINAHQEIRKKGEKGLVFVFLGYVFSGITIVFSIISIILRLL